MNDARIEQKAKELGQMVNELGLLVFRDTGCERHCWALLAGGHKTSIARFQNLEELERFLRWATEKLAKSHSL